MEMFGERIGSETPELDDEGVRMRFIGRREGVDPALVERMDWAEADDRRATTGSRSSSPSTTAAGRRSSTRRGSFEGELRGGVPQPPLRARDARPRPPDPDQRRAAALQLPALAVRLLRAGLPRRALARLRPRARSRTACASTRRGSGASGAEDVKTSTSSTTRLLRGRAAVRRGERPPRKPQRRRGGGSGETAKRILVALPWIVFAIAITVAGGLVFAAGDDRDRRRRACASTLTMAEPLPAARRSPPTSPSPAWSSPPTSAPPSTSCYVLAATFPLLFAFARQTPAPRGRHRLDRGDAARGRSGSASRSPTRSSCATCPTTAPRC